MRYDAAQIAAVREISFLTNPIPMKDGKVPYVKEGYRFPGTKSYDKNGNLKPVWCEDFARPNMAKWIADGNPVAIIPSTVGMAVPDIDHMPEISVEYVIETCGEPIYSHATPGGGVHPWYKWTGKGNKDSGKKIANANGDHIGEFKVDRGYVVLYDPVGVLNAIMELDDHDPVDVVKLLPKVVGGDSEEYEGHSSCGDVNTWSPSWLQPGNRDNSMLCVGLHMMTLELDEAQTVLDRALRSYRSDPKDGAALAAKFIRDFNRKLAVAENASYRIDPDTERVISVRDDSDVKFDLDGDEPKRDKRKDGDTRYPVNLKHGFLPITKKLGFEYRRCKPTRDVQVRRNEGEWRTLGEKDDLNMTLAYASMKNSEGTSWEPGSAKLNEWIDMAANNNPVNIVAEAYRLEFEKYGHQDGFADRILENSFTFANKDRDLWKIRLASRHLLSVMLERNLSDVPLQVDIGVMLTSSSKGIGKDTILYEMTMPDPSFLYEFPLGKGLHDPEKDRRNREESSMVLFSEVDTPSRFYRLVDVFPSFVSSRQERVDHKWQRRVNKSPARYAVSLNCNDAIFKYMDEEHSKLFRRLLTIEIEDGHPEYGEDGFQSYMSANRGKIMAEVYSKVHETGEWRYENTWKDYAIAIEEDTARVFTGARNISKFREDVERADVHHCGKIPLNAAKDLFPKGMKLSTKEWYMRKLGWTKAKSGTKRFWRKRNSDGEHEDVRF